MQKEFTYIEKFLRTPDGKRYANGIDVGCGTNRLSPDIPSLDQQPDLRYAHAQFVWDCATLDLFADGVLDFIFSSHCLEDFEDIPKVFMNWWKKIKPSGLMILLLPDMETGRYPKVGDSNGNPSHRTNTGKMFVEGMLDKLQKDGILRFEILQCDTIPHNESCSIDFVIRKIQ